MEKTYEKKLKENENLLQKKQSCKKKKLWILNKFLKVDEELNQLNAKIELIEKEISLLNQQEIDLKLEIGLELRIQILIS